MKKVLLMVLAGVLAGAFAPARAADDGENKFEFDGMVRARYEYLNNYLDQFDNQSGSSAFDDAFGVTPYRVMIGMTGMFAHDITAHADLQYVGSFGDENPNKDFDPFAPNGGPTGQGDTSQRFATQGVQLYQGWLELGHIGGSDFSVRAGRAEHTYGTEFVMGDNDFYSGQSFDGVRGMWQHGASDLNVFYYKVAERNCIFGIECDGLGGSTDANLFGGTYDWTFKNWGTVGGYIIVGQDLESDTKVNNIGVRWNRDMMTGDKLNMFDWNVEYLMQTGDFDGITTPETKIKGMAYELWFAFNFNAGNSHGRVHIGTLATSGDDLTTTDNEEYVDMFGDFHAHNRFGDLDWVDQNGQSDTTDYNIGYEHWFGTNHYVMLAYHMFQETESNGAAEDKIGDEIDLKYGYQMSKNLAFSVMIGQASPNDDFFGGPTDPVQRIYGQAEVRW